MKEKSKTYLYLAAFGGFIIMTSPVFNIPIPNTNSNMMKFVEVLFQSIPWFGGIFVFISLLYAIKTIGIKNIPNLISSIIEKRRREADEAEIKINAYMLDKSEQNEAGKYFENKLLYSLLYDVGIQIMGLVSFFLTFYYYSKFWFITLVEQGDISMAYYNPVIFSWIVYCFLKFNPIYRRYNKLETRYLTIKKYYEIALKNKLNGKAKDGDI